MSIIADKRKARLQAELMSLSAAANECAKAFQTANWLPEGFPEDQLYTLLDTLSEFQNGTLVRSRIGLSYSARRLYTIRGEYTELSEVEFDDERIERDSHLDQRLVHVGASIHSCLEAYRGAFADLPEETYDEAEKDVSLSDRRDLSKRAQNVSNTSEEFRNEISESAAGQSDSIEDAKRNLQDVANVSALGRFELGFKRVTPKFLEALGEGIVATANAAAVAGKAIVYFSDMAEPVLSRYSEFQGNLQRFLLSEARQTGLMFIELSQRVTGHTANGVAQSSQSDDEDVFSEWITEYVSVRSRSNAGVSIVDLSKDFHIKQGVTGKVAASDRGFSSFISYLDSLDRVVVYTGFHADTVVPAERTSYFDRQCEVNFQQVRIAIERMPPSGSTVKSLKYLQSRFRGQILMRYSSGESAWSMVREVIERYYL